jgi:hypothetical protein
LRVSRFSTAMLSSEEIILTAALMVPSSILAEILVAREEGTLDLREGDADPLQVTVELLQVLVPVTFW